MEAPKASIPSITDRLRPVATQGSLAAVRFIGDVAVFVGDEEAVTLADGKAEPRRVEVAFGGILCSAGDGKRLLLGTDDGKVVAVDGKGGTETVASDAKRRWIDNVALHADGGIAWSAGKTAFARAAKGEVKSVDVASTVGGLAFAPKGFRLAVAQYNGVSLWFPNMSGTPDFLEWKGSHLGVTFSPDGRFLITTMHESALHGWRLADSKHMRMTGYPSRVRSMSWTADGRGLATSGADCVIVWPFATKDGPMGKEPGMFSPLKAKVTAVACHPDNAVTAAGYSDGTVLLIRMNDGAEILARRNDGVAVASLAWNAAGSHLAIAMQSGGGALLPF